MAALSQPGGAALIASDIMATANVVHYHDIAPIGTAHLMGYTIPVSTSHEYWSSQ